MLYWTFCPSCTVFTWKDKVAAFEKLELHCQHWKIRAALWALKTYNFVFHEFMDIQSCWSTINLVTRVTFQVLFHSVLLLLLVKILHKKTSPCSHMIILEFSYIKRWQKAYSRSKTLFLEFMDVITFQNFNHIKGSLKPQKLRIQLSL